jgi:hypothetical protein
MQHTTCFENTAVLDCGMLASIESSVLWSRVHQFSSAYHERYALAVILLTGI